MNKQSLEESTEESEAATRWPCMRDEAFARSSTHRQTKVDLACRDASGRPGRRPLPGELGTSASKKVVEKKTNAPLRDTTSEP